MEDRLFMRVLIIYLILTLVLVFTVLRNHSYLNPYTGVPGHVPYQE